MPRFTWSSLLLFPLLLSASCSSDEGAPELEMLHAVHKGNYVALVDGGSVLYGLSVGKLTLLTKGATGGESATIPIPAGLPGDSAGPGALLLAGKTLYGALRTSVFAFDVTNATEPKLLFQDKTSGGASLALGGTTLFVALGPQITAYDVGNPSAWTMLPGGGKLSGEVPSTFMGPSSIALDEGRGLVVLAARDSLEVRKAADLSPVRQTETATAVATPLWSLVGIRDKNVIVCAAQEGLRSIPLRDDGVLGTATTIEPSSCTGTLSGDSAWLGLPFVSSGQRAALGSFGKMNFSSGTLTKYNLSSMNVVDPVRANVQPGGYGAGAFRGVVENGDFTYLNIGEIWVLAARD